MNTNRGASSWPKAAAVVFGLLTFAFVVAGLAGLHLSETMEGVPDELVGLLETGTYQLLANASFALSFLSALLTVALVYASRPLVTLEDEDEPPTVRMVRPIARY